MASKKISELPISTDYSSSTSYIPGIVDGVNVKFSASDLAQSGNSTWKTVLEDSSTYGKIPSDSSKVIYNGKLKSLLNIRSDFDRYVASQMYIGDDGFVVNDNNGGSGFTFHSNGYLKLGVQNAASSTYPGWGYTDEEFCFVADDMAVKMVMNYPNGTMIGFNVQPRIDGTTASGLVIHQGGPEVIGMPLSLQYRGTQPDHALRKDQIEELVASNSSNSYDEKLILKDEIIEIVEDVILEKESTDVLSVDTVAPSSSSAYGNYGWIQLNSDVLEAGYFTKFTIWAYSSATATGDYNLVVYEQDESAPNGWKKLGWSNERVKMNANKVFEWTFTGIKIDGSKPIRIMAAYDPTTTWGTTSATANAAPIRIKIVTTALAEGEVQASYISSSVVLSDNFLSSNNIYYRAACGFTITEYDRTSLNKVDKHINNKTIHNTLEEVNESVKKEQLLVLETYEFNKDGNGNVRDNAGCKSIFLDPSKVPDGYLTGITLRGAKTNGTSNQCYLAVYQLNEAGTAYEWVGASTNTDNFTSSANPTPLHSWSFDKLKIIGGRQVAIVALDSPDEPSNLSTAAKSMRIGTITFEANTTTVADTAPDAVLATQLYNYSVAINFQMLVPVGDKYATANALAEHAEHVASSTEVGHVSAGNGLGVQDGALFVDVADSSYVVEEGEYNPVVFNAAKQLCVPMVSRPWVAKILSSDNKIEFENNAVYSFVAGERQSTFCPEDYFDMSLVRSKVGMMMFFIGIPIADSFTLKIKSSSNDFSVDDKISAYPSASDETYTYYTITGKQGIVLDCKFFNAGGMQQVFMSLSGIY